MKQEDADVGLGAAAASGTPQRLSKTTAALLVVWIAGLLGGMVGPWKYKLTPGPSTSTVALWPAQSHLPVQPNTPTLVVFAHPQCDCTRATLSELRTLVSRFGSQLLTTIVFLNPTGVAGDWKHSKTWDSAASIPGVRVLADEDGREASLFGAATSGHVVLYSGKGRLLFSGGITPARGHVGGSPQMDSLVQRLESETAGQSTQALATQPPDSTIVPGAVYGCPLGETIR
jgi:hypothetical protein